MRAVEVVELGVMSCMKRVVFSIIMAITCLSVLSNISLANVKKNVNQSNKTSYSSSQIIVKFRKNTSKSTKQSSHSLMGAKIKKKFKHFPNTHIMTLPASMSMEKAMAIYAKNPNVEFAEPDYTYFTSLTPNDIRFDEMWGLNNSGQTGGLADADINAPEAWDITTGSSSIIVAVIDTGIDYTHPDLVDNTWVNPGEIAGNNIDDDGNGYIDDVHGINTITGSGDPMDDYGHGTHVFGTIAAKGNNSIGVTGVNWQIKVIGCKFLSSSGSGSVSDAIECLDYLLGLKTRSTNPVDIILSNNSWGGGGESQALFNAIRESRDAGMLFVAAAGNSSSNNDSVNTYPANYDLSNVISVSASDHNDALASFTNYGRRSVEVGAPGVSILSTVPTGSCSLCDDTGYGILSGTSMATPHAAGVLALIKADDPTMDWAELKNLLISSGETVSAFSSKTITSKRIRAADVGGVGALTCSGQIVNQRVTPIADSLNIVIGEPVTFVVLHSNCESANGNVSVSITGSDSVLLKDDGLGVDTMANDGLYSATYTATSVGTITAGFPGSDSVTLTAATASTNYQTPVSTSYSYRSITGTALSMSDDSVRTITSPFSIQYAGADPGFTTLYVSSNGMVRLNSSSISYLNRALPYSSYQYVIAPMWDDFNPTNGGDVYWEVQGISPNRELIIEWRDIPHYQTSGTVTFQVVFFEESSDVLFNYADVYFSNSSYDYGASATIGLQNSSILARQYSYNTASLTDSLALLWSYNESGAHAGYDQTANPNTQVTLDGAGSSGTIVSYSWSQTSGTSVSLNNATTTSPSFTAPSTSGRLSFKLTATDNVGNVTSDTIDVVINAAPTANAGADRTVSANIQIVLDGTSSTDSDGLISKYTWTQISGTTVTLSNDTTTASSFVAPVFSSTLSFTLTIMDTGGLVASDTVTIVVLGLLVADAGSDQEAAVETLVTLDASGSLANEGISGYSWSQTSGTSVDLSGAATATPSFTMPSSGSTLVFELTVTDSTGNSATDTVSISVPVSSSGGGGGGGCSVGTGSVNDPMLPGLVLLFILGLVGRRWKQDNTSQG